MNLSSRIARRHSTLSACRKTQHGFITTEFVWGIAFLLLPVALLVITLPTWQERQTMARVAARDAARSYVLNADSAQAQQVVDEITTNYRLNKGDVELTLDGDPPSQRGGKITATVKVKVPVANIALLNLRSPEFTFDESHTEYVDLYRSARQ